MVSLCLGEKACVPSVHILHGCPVVIMLCDWESGKFLTVYWGTTSGRWPEWTEFLKIWAKLTYFVIVSFRKLYSDIQLFVLYQAAYSGIMEKLFPSRSFHIISPCQAQYALKHLNLFCTLRVSFACVGSLSRAKTIIYWGCRLSAQWTIFYLGLHEGCFLKNLCRVFPEPFNNEESKRNKAQAKSPTGTPHFGLSPLLLLNIHFQVLLKPSGTTSCSVNLVLPSSAGFQLLNVLHLT